MDILQTSGRPIRATPVAPKRSQSSEASNWELLPLPNATDATGWRITVWSQSKNFNACKKLGVFQNSSNIVTAVPQRTILGVYPQVFTLQLFISGSILYGHSDGFSQCFAPLGCPNHVRPERSLWELVPGVPRSLTPHPSIKRVSIWCYTKLCGYKQGSRNDWNHTVSSNWSPE